MQSTRYPDCAANYPGLESKRTMCSKALMERRPLDLFAGNSQLIIYHFMYAPGEKEGCVGCSFLADHIDGANLHLAHHDVSLMECREP